MKKYILSLLTILCITACDKLPSNGDLDGMWQLMSIEHNGIVTDVKSNQEYWSIRKNLVQFNDLTDSRKFAHFQRQGDTFVIYDLCHESRNEKGDDNDEWITYDERDILAKWGLFPEPDSQHPERLSQTFRFELLNYDNMILTSGSYRLIFRKF